MRSVVIIYKLKRSEWSNTATNTANSPESSSNSEADMMSYISPSGVGDIPLGGMMLRTMMISLMNNVMTYYLPLISVCLISTQPPPVGPQLSGHMTSN